MGRSFHFLTLSNYLPVLDVRYRPIVLNKSGSQSRRSEAESPLFVDRPGEIMLSASSSNKFAALSKPVPDASLTTILGSVPR